MVTFHLMAQWEPLLSSLRREFCSDSESEVKRPVPYMGLPPRKHRRIGDNGVCPHCLKQTHLGLDLDTQATYRGSGLPGVFGIG